MLAWKEKQIDYITFSGNEVVGLTAFFFGNNIADDKEKVYQKYDSSSDKSNIIMLRQMTGLNSLLNKNTKIGDGMNISDKQHVLMRKKEFVETLVNETAITLLKMINRILWIDEFDSASTTGKKAGEAKRWRSSDVPVEDAFKIVKTIAKSMTDLFELMIDTRFDYDIVADKLKNDYEKLVLEYTQAAGGGSRNKKKYQ
jgi:hypothetical protein